MPRASAASWSELEAQCARQLAELREQLQTVRHDDHTTWALVARDTAGILAAWSLRTEPDPGPLAEGGRAIARSAQLRAARVPGRPRRAFPPMQMAAQLVRQPGRRAPRRFHRPGRAGYDLPVMAHGNDPSLPHEVAACTTLEVVQL